MPDRIDYDVMTRMLSAAARRVREQRDMLSSLDAATGDGDHGAAMCKVADAITETISSHGDRDIPSLLSAIGWAAMGTDAGATGPLYGSLFVGMSESGVGCEGMDGVGFAAMMQAGAVNLGKNTKAAVGDKTMIDALTPAIEAIRLAADAGRGLSEVLEAGATAAAAGAEATKNMRAAFGRARNIGERAMGHVDPGATSISLVFAGFKEGFSDG